MSPKELAHKHGYVDEHAAARAVVDARNWVRKHPGRKRPAHIQRAVDLVADMRQQQVAEEKRIQGTMKRLAMNPRTFLAVVPPGAKFERARRWLRNRFALHFGVEAIVRHFVQLVPLEYGEHYLGSGDKIRGQALRNLAYGIEKIYGASYEVAQEAATRVSNLMVRRYQDSLSVE